MRTHRFLVAAMVLVLPLGLRAAEPARAANKVNAALGKATMKLSRGLKDAALPVGVVASQGLNVATIALLSKLHAPEPLMWGVTLPVAIIGGWKASEPLEALSNRLAKSDLGRYGAQLEQAEKKAAFDQASVKLAAIVERAKASPRTMTSHEFKALRTELKDALKTAERSVKRMDRVGVDVYDARRAVSQARRDVTDMSFEISDASVGAPKRVLVK